MTVEIKKGVEDKRSLPWAAPSIHYIHGRWKNPAQFSVDVLCALLADDSVTEIHVTDSQNRFYIIKK